MGDIHPFPPRPPGRRLRSPGVPHWTWISVVVVLVLVVLLVVAVIALIVHLVS